MLVLDGGAEPRRLDLVALDAGVLRRLLEGLHHQVLGIGVPALTELRAAHAEDDDLVLDSGSHGKSPLMSS